MGKGVFNEHDIPNCKNFICFMVFQALFLFAKRIVEKETTKGARSKFVPMIILIVSISKGTKDTDMIIRCHDKTRLHRVFCLVKVGLEFDL